MKIATQLGILTGGALLMTVVILAVPVATAQGPFTAQIQRALTALGISFSSGGGTTFDSDVTMGAGTQIVFNGGSELDGNTTDVIFQFSGTDAQTWRLFETRADPSNGQWLELDAGVTTADEMLITPAQNGSETDSVDLVLASLGTSGDIRLQSSDDIFIGRNNVTSLQLIPGAASSSATLIEFHTTNGTLTSATQQAFLMTGEFRPASGTPTNKFLTLEPTLNWGGTPSSGHYEVFSINAIETAIPTGTNYLARWQVGSTDIFTVQTNGTMVIADPTSGGDAGERATISANFKINVKSLGVMSNGTTETTELTDDTPAGECAAVGAGNVDSDDGTIRRVGSNSLKLAFDASVSAAEGVDCDITSDDWQANESVGFWFRADTTIAASGDIYMEADEADTAAATFNLPAYATANVWVWIELDISSCAGCNTIDGIKFLVDAEGATQLTSNNMWFDFVYKWDLDDEDTLSADIVQDGVLGCTGTLVAEGTNNIAVDLVENTSFFVHYQSTDVIVIIDDQSANYGTCFIATT